LDRYRVKPNQRVDLAKSDPNDTSEFSGNKADAEQRLEKLSRKLEQLQEMLYAEHEHKLLVVLQSMDTGGKDGTIRHVFEGVNPQGVKVVRFQQPTQVELDHDYLWRIHPNVPAKGDMVIFNRSHYEDVLIVRVHDLVPEDVWRRRYGEITEFERMLVNEGMTILKFFLHISKDEQKKRLRERLDDPQKHWKFALSDVRERAYWGKYQKAYQDAIEKTSTEWAPWYIVPANHKWYRNFVIATTITDTLAGLKMKYPKPKLPKDLVLK